MIRIPTRFAAILVGTGLAWAAFPYQSPLAQVPAAGATLALTGGRVIDGTGAAPLERATILIANGRIQAVGPGTSVAIPAGATRVDMSGKTIMPGLINAHGHLNADQSNRPTRDKLAGQLRLYADYGVTTVQVLGIGLDSVGEALRLRDEQSSGGLERARVLVAAQSLRDLKTADEARARVNDYADRKVDIIKMHIPGGPGDMTPEVYGALIDQAHRRGLRTAAHLFYLRDAKGLLDKGIDVIAHSIRDQPVDADVIAAIKARNVGYIPTLTRDLAQFVYESTPAFFMDTFFLRHVDAYRREMTLLSDPANQQKMKNSREAQDIKQALAQGSRNLKALSDAGVLIAMGTDTGTNEGQWQGYFEHMELEYMVKAGLTPMQALVAATSGGARLIKRENELGAIQAGRQADLLVLNADPLADIKNTRQIDSVWIAGRRLTQATSSN